ncbi:MAG: type IV pilus biogenesis protein PilM, partial [Candidatus Acidiferrales bacterium]
SAAHGSGPRGRLFGWLDAMPHPATVLEIAATHVAAARWGRGVTHLSAFAAETLPDGAIVPSATQQNVLNQDAVRSAIHSVLCRVPAQGQDVALLVPDTVIRVFILPFDTFPRRADEARPLLRWRLKKSLPFDAEEAVISWMRQAGREGKIEVVAAVARQKISREYESAVEAEGIFAGVVQSSTLATLPLLDPNVATLLARMSGRNLTTVIVRGETLCVYRSTELGTETDVLKPQTVFDEVFPALAFYQDTWGGKVEQLRVAGFGVGEEGLREMLGREIGCPAEPLATGGEFSAEARSLVAQGLESLVGWQFNRGA